MYAHYDVIVGTLVGAGFSYHLAHRALHALGSLPLGFAQEIFSPASAGGSMEVDTAEADMAEAVPHLTAMVAAEIHDATDPRSDGATARSSSSSPSTCSWTGSTATAASFPTCVRGYARSQGGK